MKVNKKHSIVSIKKIVLITLAVCFTVLVISFLLFRAINKTSSDFESDQFGSFSNKTYALEIEDSIEAKTKFKLSDKSELLNFQNNIIDDEADSVYELSYGSYPIITTELAASRLTTAYAMSILGMSYEKAMVFTGKDKTVVPHLFMYPVERNINLGTVVEENGAISQTILNTKDNYADISIVSSDGLISLMYYAKENKVDLVYKNFAKDALVVFTSAENSIDSISKEELKAIYNGNIKNWSKLGGSNKKILKYERCIHSPAQEAFEIYALDMYQQQKEWNEILDITAHKYDRQEYVNSSNSIGYCLKSQFDIAYAQDDDIKILKIEDTLPTEKNIISGIYPLCVPYYYVYKLEDEHSTAERFVDWMQTDEGIKCIRSAGMISTNTEKEYLFIDGESKSDLFS